MENKKTPGVNIVEKNAHVNPIVEAATSIPVFIGITEKAEKGGTNLAGKPFKIYSMVEFRNYFGGPSKSAFTLSTNGTIDSRTLYAVKGEDKNNSEVMLQVQKPETFYTLYYNMVMFFANGGGGCYIVSIGNYQTGDKIEKGKVEKALKTLEAEPEITIVVVPEAVNADECKEIQQLVLNHCGKMGNRFAIFDVQPKKSTDESIMDQIKKFRANIGSNFLSYGAAYYPWLNTSVVSDNDIDGTIISWDYGQEQIDLTLFTNVNKELATHVNTYFAEIKAKMSESSSHTDNELIKMKNDLHKFFLNSWSEYRLIVKSVKDSLNLLPPSAAMAGIYTSNDNTRGVWKAPANLTVNCVKSLSEEIDNTTQEKLNVPIDGKSINSIRTFIGEGIRIWGARTLDGNSLDRRYVNICRTILFLQETIKNGVSAYALEPNDAKTWKDINGVIESFLQSIWKRGALAGANSEEAYSIHLGLGDTMTSRDIEEGIIRIKVLVAISRPTEFIEISFGQKMQKR